MTTLLCPNTTSDKKHYTKSDPYYYSAPVPFIGLYIAAATALCFLLMFGDVLKGFRNRKKWFRFFPLNSITLTLLAVAAKIPVDLTTHMPNAYDQLSKLTGTNLVCVCMAFLLPSIGSTRSSESVPNIAALSILVITIVVNICIQLYTGVIFSFFAEHVIIMSCMLIMVILFWSCNWEIITYKEFQMDRKNDLLTKGGECLFTRLKLYYLHGYDSNPQFKIFQCRYIVYADLASFTCVFIVLKATVRSLFTHEAMFFSCSEDPDDPTVNSVVIHETSDYGWPIKIIVVTQILVILLAGFGACRRLSPIINPTSKLRARLPDSLDFQIINPMLMSFPFLKGNTMDYLNVVMRYAVNFIAGIVLWILPIPGVCCMLLRSCLGCLGCLGSCTIDDTESQGIKEYQDLVSENDLELEYKTLKKCAENVVRWSEKGKSLGHLKNLFSERPPSQYSLQELKSQIGLEEGKEISCLHLVFLVKVASVSTQSTICDHLTRKVFDITQFVDEKLNSSTFTNRKRRILAKAMWKGKDFISPLPTVEGERLHHALNIIGKLKDVLFTSDVWEELDFIMDSINDQEYESVEGLKNYLEQLFVDMLYIFLSQLPCAIYKHVNESQIEDYEESVRCTLKFLGQVQSLDEIVEWSWSFPEGIGIQRLMPPQASSTDQNNTGGTSDSEIVIQRLMPPQASSTNQNNIGETSDSEVVINVIDSKGDRDEENQIDESV